MKSCVGISAVRDRAVDRIYGVPERPWCIMIIINPSDFGFLRNTGVIIGSFLFQ